MGTEPDTDISSLDIDLTVVSDRVVADHQDDGEVGVAKPRLAASRPRSASPGHRIVTHQASKLWMNVEITHGSANHVDVDVAKEVRDEGADVLAKGDGDDEKDVDDAHSTRMSCSPTASCNNPASDSNISVSKLQASEHGSAKSPHLGLAVVTLHRSDLKNDPSTRQNRRRNSTRNVLRKQPCTTPCIELAGAVSAVPSTLESNDGGSDDSNDEDYSEMSDAAPSKTRGRPRSRKRVRRAKDTEHNDMVSTSTPSLNFSCQAVTASPSDGVQESEEIPVHGYLTLKTIESKVVYCLTFSQDLLPGPRRTSQRQGTAKSVSSISDRRDSEWSPLQERATNIPARNSRFPPEDDELLLQLKGEGLSWDMISHRFPGRSKGTLQVHYSTKLKPRSETSKNTKKRRRSG